MKYSRLISFILCFMVVAPLIIILSTSNDNEDVVAQADTEIQKSQILSDEKQAHKTVTAELISISGELEKESEQINLIPNTDNKKQIDDIQQLIQCYSDIHCDRYELSDDPKNKHLQISTQLVAIADGFMRDIESNKPQVINEVATQLISFPESKVQLSALKLFSLLPKDEENLSLILGVMNNHHDGYFFYIGMQEIARYNDSEKHRQEIDELYKNTLLSGAHNTAEALASKISTFISEKNIAYYEEIAKKLPRASRRSRLLRLAISDYRLNNNSDK